MSGDIDDVISTRHHVNIAVFIDIACVRGFIVAWIICEVGIEKSLLRIPQGWKTTAAAMAV